MMALSARGCDHLLETAKGRRSSGTADDGSEIAVEPGQDLAGRRLDDMA
jgi:hypothetical protein